MATITLKGNAIETVGALPAKGAAAPAFALVRTDLSEATLDQYKGKKVVLNIFPSIDTPTCAASVRQFNKTAGELANTAVRVAGLQPGPMRTGLRARAYAEDHDRRLADAAAYAGACVTLLSPAGAAHRGTIWAPEADALPA